MGNWCRNERQRKVQMEREKEMPKGDVGLASQPHWKKRIRKMGTPVPRLLSPYLQLNPTLSRSGEFKNGRHPPLQSVLGGPPRNNRCQKSCKTHVNSDTLEMAPPYSRTQFLTRAGEGSTRTCNDCPTGQSAVNPSV